MISAAKQRIREHYPHDDMSDGHLAELALVVVAGWYDERTNEVAQLRAEVAGLRADEAAF